MFDLDIPYETVKKQPEILDKLYEFGYRSIAISETGQKKPEPCTLPNTQLMNQFNKTLEKRNGFTTSQLDLNSQVMNIYTRLNITDPPQNYFTPAIMESFNLIAVKPTNDKSFQMACQQLDIDIIILDMSVKLPFHLKHTNVNMAIQKGIMFEITYTQAIRDQSVRKNVIANSMELIKKTKGKNVIVSSDCKEMLELRGTFDVMNLCTLFTMNPNMARDALNLYPRQAILHGLSRQKTFRGILSFEKIEQVPDSQKWKVQRLEKSVDVHS